MGYRDTDEQHGSSSFRYSGGRDPEEMHLSERGHSHQPPYQDEPLAQRGDWADRGGLRHRSGFAGQQRGGGEEWDDRSRYQQAYGGQRDDYRQPDPAWQDRASFQAAGGYRNDGRTLHRYQDQDRWGADSRRSGGWASQGYAQDTGNWGWGQDYDREAQGGYEGLQGHGGYGGQEGGRGSRAYGSSSRQQQHRDPDYHQWREEQLRMLDDDYESWRKERYQKFSDEFNAWRSNRTGRAGTDAEATSGQKGGGSQAGVSGSSTATTATAGSATGGAHSTTGKAGKDAG